MGLVFYMAQSITMSFSAPLELSIQMEECMENTGFNRSELIKIALSEYFKTREEKKRMNKIIEDTYEVVLEIRNKVSLLK